GTAYEPLFAPAAQGGALHLESCATVVANCRFLGNAATEKAFSSGQGGAVYLAGGSAQFVNCLFSGNVARPTSVLLGSTGPRGGAVFVTGFSPFLLPFFQDCTIAGNTASSPPLVPGGIAGGIYGDC